MRKISSGIAAMTDAKTLLIPGLETLRSRYGINDDTDGITDVNFWRNP